MMSSGAFFGGSDRAFVRSILIGDSYPTNAPCEASDGPLVALADYRGFSVAPPFFDSMSGLAPAYDLGVYAIGFPMF